MECNHLEITISIKNFGEASPCACQDLTLCAKDIPFADESTSLISGLGENGRTSKNCLNHPVIRICSRSFTPHFTDCTLIVHGGAIQYSKEG